MINIVLFEPEMPQNTGNIMRTCAGTDTLLHLIEPLGFKVDEASLKRAAVNYLPNVHFKVYKNWEEFLEQNNGKMYFFTRYGTHTPHELKLNEEGVEYYFVIGKESTGIPKEILREDLEHCMRIPMTSNVRALNLSNCAAIVLYEVLRQQDYRDLLFEEPHKDKDFITLD